MFISTLSILVPVVDTLRTAAVFSVSPTESPLAAAEILALRVAFSRSGAVRQRKLRAAPSVFPPESHPVLDPLLVRPVVHTVGAVAVLRPGATVAPVRAAVVLASNSEGRGEKACSYLCGSVTLARLTVSQRELWSTPPV